MLIPDYTVSQFKGLNTFIKDTKTLAKGVAKDELNWVTSKFGDNIGLRQGMQLLTETRVTGEGHITGLGIGKRVDKTAIPFWSHDRKIKHFDADAEDFVEIGTDALPAAADGQDLRFEWYQNLAGAFMYIGNKFMNVFKLPVANPSSYVEQSVNNNRFNVFVFGKGRMLAGQRNGTVAGNKDETALYLSQIDKVLLSGYTQITGEAIGALGDTAYTGTLADRTGSRTVMYVQIKEAGGETLNDDRNGNLVGDQGSTGTINYATGEYSVTFNHTTTGSVTADYYWEDATSGGVLDFDTSNPGAGEPKIFRQDDGGGIVMAILTFLNVHYALHELLTWTVSIALDDTDSDNQPYRKLGIPTERAATLTPKGILVVDTANPKDPKIRRLQIKENSDNLTIVPDPISDSLDLSVHAFDDAYAGYYGEYDLFGAKNYTSGVADEYNSVMYIHNTESGAWDKLDYAMRMVADYNGLLLGGHSITPNVYVLFSGYDDDGSPITNFWEDGFQNCDTDRLKRMHKMKVAGLIQKTQRTRVSLAFDDGDYSEYFTIDGTDARYVSHGINVVIGSNTPGASVIGGGGTDTAHPFEVEFGVHSPKFETVSVRFEALDIGYVQINEYTYKDIRDKGSRSRSSIVIN